MIQNAPITTGLHRRKASDRPRTIGLLAGSGRFPILFAEAARRQGLPVACVAIRYEASEELRSICDAFEVVGVSKLGRMIRTFRKMNAERIVMAGPLVMA